MVKLPGMNLARAMGELDLTDEQQAALDDVRDDLRDRMRDMYRERKEDRIDAMEAFLSGELTADEMHARVDAHSAERAALAHASIDGFLGVYETLTEDQKAQLSTLLKERAEQRQEAGPSGRSRSPRSRAR